MKQIKIAAFSDTHGNHRSITVPDADVVVFAGDLMTCGRKRNEIADFANWWNRLPHSHKVLVAGNHDRLFESNPADVLHFFNDTHYLFNSSCQINGFNFWGSPYTPWFCNWAFSYYRKDGNKYWDRIPNNTDVLITHGPPYGVLDYCIPMPQYNFPGDRVGCPELYEACLRVKPKVHIFGHIHAAHGTDNRTPIDYHNVSICDDSYEPIYEPHLITVERE